jgi:hypothetical protein
MALPFEPMHRKFVTVDGTHVTRTVPSSDDWERMDRSFAEDYMEGAGVDVGLEGRAANLRSYGPTGENNIRQYHVNESRNKKREKRESAGRSIRSR